MQHIIVFEKQITKDQINNYIANYSKLNGSGYYKHDKLDNVYITNDDGEVRCNVQITMPSTINTEYSFKENNKGGIEIKEYEDTLYDRCLDLQADDYNIDQAEVYVQALYPIILSEKKTEPKLLSFLQILFGSDILEIKKYRYIKFIGAKTNYILDLDYSQYPTDDNFENFI